MQINIDNSSGFCWGVVRTIDIVEETIEKNPNTPTYILGEIIHNPMEVQRLADKGLKTIDHDDFENLPKDANVIIRAHGEPPATYQRADKNNIHIIDATCPLVQTLQQSVRKFHENDFQIVIFGKPQHPEVKGLLGVSNNESIVVQSVEEALTKVDFSKKTVLLSQTTMDKPTFYAIKDALEKRITDLVDGGELQENNFLTKHTICKFVSGREEPLIQFAKEHDIMIFVAGRNSSNGKSLYYVCKDANPNTYFIERHEELDLSWFDGVDRVGISGATSTPQWYMEEVRSAILEKLNVVAE
jgi:4-hydroxy-3-methylbut-2-enyl diphosphate reductase